MVHRSIELQPPELATDSLGFFRWGSLGDKILLTSDAGDWEILSQQEFADLLAGRVTASHPRFADLQRKGFLIEGLDLDGLAARVAQRTRHMRRGPFVYVITMTRRGSTAASEPGADDMSAATAEQIVDLALQSSSPSLTFELQADGGEPLLNFDVVRHLVEIAVARNKRAAGKKLTFRLSTSFSAMSEEAARWLIDNDVMVRTTLDGPADVHDWNRQWLPGNAHADTIRWIEHFNRRYAELGRDVRLWHVDTQAIATRRTLDEWRRVVDEYVARGLRSLWLRPLLGTQLSADAWSAVGYTAEEYLTFYRQVFDHVLELNRRGVDISERMAVIFSTKILTSEDPGVVDIQSPCGDGMSQLAYDVDGRIFPCEDARLIAAAGDPLFEIGRTGTSRIEDLVRHPTVRAIAAASLLDAQPQCSDCWNKPFCGFSPVRNYITQGDLFGQRPRCFQCKQHMAVSRRIFEVLAGEGDAAGAEILKRWAAARPAAVNESRTLPGA